MSDCWKLLGEIAHCPIVNAILSGDARASVHCRKIVGSQGTASFQLPEPWSGQIDVAPLLFISSNPSVDALEEYPDESWQSDRTNDFFHNRFTSAAGWVDGGLRALRRDGSRSQWIRFWASARARAGELLRKKKSEVVPGIDFALTEVVHCKSQNEEGVREAQEFCAERYLEKVLSISAARVLIVYGKPAREAISHCLGPLMVTQPHGLSLVSIADNPRILVFLPHPNERGSRKSLEANIGVGGLALVREYLKEEPHT